MVTIHSIDSCISLRRYCQVCGVLVTIAQLGLALSKGALVWRNLPNEDFFQKDPIFIFFT